MQLVWKSLAGVALMVATAGLYAGEVKTDYNHNTKFSQLASYSWGGVSMTDANAEKRIREAVDRNLQSKGWTLVHTGASAVVFAKDGVQNEQQIEAYYTGLGAGWGRSWGWDGWNGKGLDEVATTPVNQPAGLVVIDIFSGFSKDLLWRGDVQEDLTNHSGQGFKNLNKDIDKMFKDFPTK